MTTTTMPDDKLAALMDAADDWVRTGEMTPESIREKREAVRAAAVAYGDERVEPLVAALRLTLGELVAIDALVGMGDRVRNPMAPGQVAIATARTALAATDKEVAATAGHYNLPPTTTDDKRGSHAGGCPGARGGKCQPWCIHYRREETSE